MYYNLVDNDAYLIYNIIKVDRSTIVLLLYFYCSINYNLIQLNIIYSK